MKKERVIKILKIVGNTLFAIFLLGAIAFSVSNVIGKNDEGIPNLFNNGYLSIATNSMNETTGKYDNYKVKSYDKGALVYVDLSKKARENVKVGDVVVFKVKLDGMSYPALITHRLVDEDIWIDKTYFLTKGDNPLNMIDTVNGLDFWLLKNDILGVVTGSTPNVGSAIAWAQSQVGFALIIILPAVVFLVFELASFIKAYTSYKTEGVGLQNELDKEKLREQLLAELKAEGKIVDDKDKSEEKPDLKE